MTDKILKQLTTMKEPLKEKLEAVAEDNELTAFKKFYKEVCETKDYMPRGLKENDTDSTNTK